MFPATSESHTIKPQPLPPLQSLQSYTLDPLKTLHSTPQSFVLKMVHSFIQPGGDVPSRIPEASEAGLGSSRVGFRRGDQKGLRIAVRTLTSTISPRLPGVPVRPGP